jgi:hypothetical protein
MFVLDAFYLLPQPMKGSKKYSSGLFGLLLCAMLSILYPSSLSAQKDQIEEKKSYNRKFPSVKKDSVAIYLDSAQKMAPSNNMRAVGLINRAIELCIISNDRSREALAYLALGNIQQNLGQHSLAIENYRRVIRSFEVMGKNKFSKKEYERSIDLPEDNTALFHAYVQMAVSQMETGMSAEALKHIDIGLGLDAVDLLEGQRNEAKRVKAKILISENKPDASIQLLNEILNEERKLRNQRGEAETLYRLGDAYAKKIDYPASNQYYTLAKQLADNGGFAEISLAANNALALYYRLSGELEKEIQIRQSNISINEQYNNSLAVSKENLEIGNAYLRNNNVEQAEPFLRQGLAEMNDANLNAPSLEAVDQPLFVQYKSARFRESAEGFLKLAEGFYNKSNFQKAIEYYTLYSQLQDSLELARDEELARAISLSSNIGKNQQRLELLEKETALNDRSIDILRKDQELKEQQLFNRNLIILTLLGCIAAILIGGFIIYRNIQARRRADKMLALRSLTGQMNPHFIFNALNSVNEFVAARDELAANRYLTSFSKLMRQVLDDSRKTLITLNDELEMLNHYLKLEHARFSDKFDYQLEISDELRDTDLMIPPMLVQPYVENAVWHGLRYKPEKGQLMIKFHVIRNFLEISIEDNGIGVAKSRELKTYNQKRQSSVGMKNTETRLNLLNEIYATGIQVSISELYPGDEEPGTAIRLIIPLGLEKLVNKS